ncbi:MAG: MFS transporter, partial [Thermoleophilaceae bacterium]|nr:MFS transporter [Thermoleophilaceae bacterium]
MEGRRSRLVPLVLATVATQSSVVVLAPIVVAVGRDLGASVSAVGQARSILSGTAVLLSLAIGPLIDRLGVRPLLVGGSALALLGAAATAAAPSLAFLYAAQAIAGAGVAALLSAGFAGVAAYFEEHEAPRAMGYVVAAQSLAWIVGNPIIGLVTDAVSWRLAYAVPACFALAALIAGRLAPAPRRGRVAAPGEEGLGGMLAVVRDRSARRWALAELIAYSAWTAELTYIGAFYIQSYGVEESLVGFLLAVGSLAFMLSTLRTARLAERFGRKRVIVAGAVGMGALLAVGLSLTPAVWFTLALFFCMALCAGVRSTGSSALGLSQLPSHPGSMMAARTASAQLGYMVGALAGGAVLALADFETLGFVLCAGMWLSALLVARVRDPFGSPAAAAPCAAA